MWLLALQLALADVRRWAVVVGNNEGFPSAEPLYFAELDAKKVELLLTSQGGVARGDLRVLLGRGRNDVVQTLIALQEPIARARAAGEQTALFFYYSGHADAEQLQLGRTGLAWKELERLLDDSGADVRVAFVDACQSGALTRTKGGTLGPGFVFDVSERLDAAGSVFITSSTDDESSQESNAIGGSYFTHFLASALAGAADDDRDGRVTLAETYRYVYHQTVYETASTRGGTQHPTYEWKLSGTGDVVLTWLDRGGGQLVFPATNPGTFAVFDTDRKLFVAEINVSDADRRLTLPPGHYLVQQRFPTWLAVAKVAIAGRQSFTLQPAQFSRFEYENDLAKGSVDRVVARARLPRLSARLGAGARSFADAEVATAYFPATPAAGAELRLDWRTGQWVSVDLFGGSDRGELVVDGLDWTVPARISMVTGGAGMGWATRPAPWRAGAGLHLDVVWIARDFPDLGLERQELVTVAPGLLLFGGWYPGRFELEAQLRGSHLPYQLDDRERGMGLNSFLLLTGYRF